MGVRATQSGYATVLLLAWLGLISVGLMKSHPSSHRHRSVWQPLIQENTQLNIERDRLLYYAVDYVNLYGPGGAGPGHLPCPDTDAGALRPGPNPPCGSNHIQHGMLPDGVSRRVGRVAFTDSLFQRSEYSVAGSVVNNPSQAMGVNQYPNELSFSHSRAGYAQLRQPSGQVRVLTQSSVESASTRWVRAWYVNHWLQSISLSCQRRNVRLHPKPSLHQLNKMPVAICSASSTLISSDVAADPVGETDPPLPSSFCTRGEDHCQISGQQLLDWWLGPDAEDWEGVRIAQHWFVSNGWLQAATFDWAPQCAEPGEVCILSVGSDEQVLQLNLLPNTSEGQ